MKNDHLRYKGFVGTAQFSNEDDVFFGKILGIRDSITYEGATVKELKKDFKAAIDDYIEFCKRNKWPLKKSLNGSFNVRIDPELHQLASQAAAEKGISLNKYVQHAIQSAVEEPAKEYQTKAKKRRLKN